MKSSEDKSSEERARQRHEQLFSKPQRILPLDRTENADAIIQFTTTLRNQVARQDLPPVPLEFCPDLVPTLLRYPELWSRLSALSALVQCADAKVPVRERQLALMRTMWLCGAPYQWGEHVSRTKAAGFSDQDLERIKVGSSDGGWNKSDQAILAASEELHADAFISDETWNALNDFFDENQLFEFIIIVGQFTSVAYLLNSIRLRLEPNNKGFLTE